MKTTYTTEDRKIFDTFRDATKHEAECLVRKLLQEAGVPNAIGDVILERASALIVPLATYADRTLQPW